MSVELANRLAWYGGMISSIIGLAWIIWQMSSRGEQPSEDSSDRKYQRKFIGIAWAVFLLPAIILIFLLGISTKGTAARGAYGSLLVGLFMPLFLATLESHISRKIRDDAIIPLARFSSMPLAAIGISLFFMGFISFIYGIRADNLWLCFIIGCALGALILRIASNLINQAHYEIMAGRMEASLFIVCSTVVAVIMAGHHFDTLKANAYLPIYMLMGIFLALLLVTVPVVLKPGKKTMDYIPGQMAIFLSIFLGICFFLVLRMNLKTDYNYPIIAGAITSVVLVVILYGSSGSVKGVDLSAGAMAALILAGGIWFSYKWGLGFGITLYSIGILSLAVILLPYKSIESYFLEKEALAEGVGRPFAPVEGDPLMEGQKKSEAGDESKAEASQEDKSKSGDAGANKALAGGDLTWAGLFLRGITVAGVAVVILGLIRVLIQKSALLDEGIDLSSGDIIAALLMGVLAALCFEGFNLFGSNIFRREEEGTYKNGVFIFVLAALGAAVIPFAMLVFYRLNGLGAFVTGISITALIGVFTYFSQKKDTGLYRGSLSPLWIALAAYSCFLIKFADLPEKLTRLQKEQICVGLILIVIAIYFLAHYKNRKADKGAELQHGEAENN